MSTVSSFECCGAGTVVQSPGGLIVKVAQNRNDFLHLNEIEIINDQGENVALKAKCYSRNIGFGGSPNCLNDGVIGNYPDVCSSHSSWSDPGNFDVCVLDHYEQIKSIRIYPLVDPERLWLTERLKNLQVEVFAGAVGLDSLETATFYGLLSSFDLVDVFTKEQTGPSNNSGEHLYVTLR